MPVRTSFRGVKKDKRSFRSRRSARSLSPQKSKSIHEYEVKNNSITLGDSENDIDFDQSIQNCPTFSNKLGSLKKLHSNFNKKYISDNVTVNSKLRWNRKLPQSPNQKDNNNTPTDMIQIRSKQSPHIPSPLYSPIKPLKKRVKENKSQNSMSISFETPPSSDESSSPKRSEYKKIRSSKKLLSSSAKLIESTDLIKISNVNTDKKTNVLRNNNLSEESVEQIGRKVVSSKYGKTNIKTKLTTRKQLKINAQKNQQYFIDEEHFNMENLLETESDKDFPIVRSPISANLRMISTPSSISSTIYEEQIEQNYFEKEESPVHTDFKLHSVKNNLKIYNKKTKSKNIAQTEQSSEDNDTPSPTDIMSLKNNNNTSEDTKENKYFDKEIVSELIKPEIDSNKSEIEINSNENSLGENNSVQNENNTSLPKSTIPVDISKENVSSPEDSKNNDSHEDSNLNQNNETFHYQVLHNRISSLKSPSSTDSAQGSSIDVETNYHPKRCEIFWGRKGNFPYWPCLIWPDPEGKTVRIEKLGHRAHISYHVKFFADNGQRSWINKDNLIAYNGKEDFDRKAKEQAKKMKNSMFRKYFVVSRAKLPIWDQAVKEADKILAVHIEKRAEVFNQILRESMELLKIHKQQRRLTISMERSSSVLSTESTEDLLNTSGISSSLSVVSKRRRSSSLYENLAKRHKIESDSEDVVKPETLVTINTDSNKYVFPKDLVEVLADYTLRTSENEESFQRFENCCTELFEIVKKSIHEEYNKGSNIKKHPNRILRKNLLGKLQKQYSQILSKPLSLNVEKVKKKRAAVDVPSLQCVLQDVIDLLGDKQYLFRNLKKGPVCKICYKTNDLFKCSGHCDSWIHKSCAVLSSEEYFEKQKQESKKKRGKKSSTEPYQRKEVNEPPFFLVTGDSDEQPTNAVDAMDFESQTEPMTTDSLISPEKIVCKDCTTHAEQFCFICQKFESKSEEDSLESDEHLLSFLKCKIPACNKYYHLSCLKLWPQAYITKMKDVTTKGATSSNKIELLCPSHTCHTCVADDARHLQLGKNNIIKCVQCPASYHFYSKCLPAGTEFLTANTIICPRHNEEIKPTNTDWCFLCSGSGNLICCDSCPSSFHLSCLKLNTAPKDKFLCELCQNGCLPLYGDLVWCKFGQYKWWPSIIIPPPIIPKNLFNKAHSRFNFCVRFLGTNDYGWTGRHRVYLYQEDDHSSDRKKDKVLQKAVDEAKIAWDFFEINKPKIDDIVDDSLPLPYKKIKSNVAVPPVKLDSNISELNPCNCSSNSDSPCGYNSQCLNRMLMIECNTKICPVKSRCENQMFEKRQYAPIAVRKTTGKGFGLVCTVPLTAGTFIIEYIGELIDDNELKRRIADKQKEKDPHYYFFSLESNLTIDAGPKGNLARFMNHSCEPNCEPQMWTVNGVKRIGLFAKNDIKEDTELTFHYNFECVGDNKVSCFCGAENCKGFIGGIYNKKSAEAKTLLQDKTNSTLTTASKGSISKQKKTLKSSR